MYLQRKGLSMFKAVLFIVLVTSIFYFYVTWHSYTSGQIFNEIAKTNSATINDSINPNEGNGDNERDVLNNSNNINQIRHFNVAALEVRNFFSIKEDLNEERADEQQNKVVENPIEHEITESNRNGFIEITPPEHSFRLVAVSNGTATKRAILQNERTGETFIVKPKDFIEGFEVIMIYKSEVILSKDNFWITVSFEK